MSDSGNDVLDKNKNNDKNKIEIELDLGEGFLPLPSRRLRMCSVCPCVSVLARVCV